MDKNFPVGIFKHGVKVVIGSYRELEKSLRKEGFIQDLSDVKELTENSEGLTFQLDSEDVVIWLREKPENNGDIATLAHEVFHATSFLLGCIDVHHNPETEEVYAYTYEHLFSRITYWLFNNCQNGNKLLSIPKNTKEN